MCSGVSSDGSFLASECFRPQRGKEYGTVPKAKSLILQRFHPHAMLSFSARCFSDITSLE